MSSTVESVTNSLEEPKRSKKRKHEGETKDSKTKKKRKQSDGPAEVNGVNESITEPSKKEKSQRRKKEQEKGVDQNSTSKSSIAQTDTSEQTSSSKEKKHKRKKQKEESQEPASPQEIEDSDIIIPDAPSQSQELVTEAEPVSTLQNGILDNTGIDSLSSEAPSPFRSVRMSLYLSAPSIGLDKATASMLALHITPLLLTYFPPAGGVILSIHDPVLSATPQASLNLPLLPPSRESKSKEQTPAYAKIGDEFGACWAWLTVTFLVYTPEPGDKIQGWTNAMSEGFVGLVSYNYFQTSIAKSRIPKSWSWSGPSRAARPRKTPRKGKLNDGDGPSQESLLDSQETVVAREDDAIDGTAGHFVDENGNKVPDQLEFQVIDLEMIPTQERGQLALQVEGTLLDEREEANVRAEEHEKFEMRKGRSRIPGTPIMSGGLPARVRAGSMSITP